MVGRSAQLMKLFWMLCTRLPQMEAQLLTSGSQSVRDTLIRLWWQLSV